jgi:GNAT superfamily N-acetyltransferase
MNRANERLEVRKVASAADLAAVYPVVRQLRPHLSEEAFIAQAERQFAGGYEAAGGFQDGRAVSFAGYRVIETLFSGLHMYVDDLVTDETCRSTGCGAAMMNWLVAEAKNRGCQCLELDSGTHRHAAHRFYFRHGMHISSFHFRMMLG